MKKFLTVLLVVAVMFTFSFSATAFATKYTDVNGYYNELAAEKATVEGYLSGSSNAVKERALEGYSFNDYGYIKADLTAQAAKTVGGYTKAALAAGYDVVIDEIKAAMNTVISDQTYAFVAGTDYNAKTAILAGVVDGAVLVSDLDEISELKDYVDGAVKGVTTTALAKDVKAAVEKKQAEATKKDVTDRITAVDAAAYPADADTYPLAAVTFGEVAYTVAQTNILAEKYSGQDYVAKVKDLALAQIEAVYNSLDAKFDTDAEKRVAYESIYEDATNGFKALLETTYVKSSEKEAADEADVAKKVEAAVNAYLNKGLGTDIYEAYKLGVTSGYANASDVDDLKAFGEPIYVAKTSTAKATLFGVEVADINNVTAAEASKINDAFYQTVKDSAETVTAYAEDAAAVKALYDGTADTLYTPAGTPSVVDEYFNTLKLCMKTADKYAKVVELGETMKAAYSNGEKVYDDAKVDAAVQYAKKLVNADLGASDKAAYIQQAVTKLYETTDLSGILATIDGATALAQAIAKAQAMLYTAAPVDETDKTHVAVISSTTKDADKVYFFETYYKPSCVEADDSTNKYGVEAGKTKAEENRDAWLEIAYEAYYDLEDAQSEDEVASIMEKAAADFGKLITAKDKAKVISAIKNNLAAWTNYQGIQNSLLTTAEKNANSASLAAIADEGVALIEAANTADEAAAGFEAAKALYDSMKSNAELKDDAAAVVNAIAGLPSTLTVDNFDEVMAVYDQFVEYAGTMGADPAKITNSAILLNDVKKVIALKEDVLEDEVVKTAKAFNALTNSDADMEKKAAMKEEIEKTIADANALNDLLDEMVEENATTGYTEPWATTADYTVEGTGLNTLASLENAAAAGGAVYNAEIYNANLAIKNAVKSGDVADAQKALDLYNALTEKQQFQVASKGYVESLKAAIKAAEDEAAAAQIESVEALKIKASSTAKKGSITVKWTVTGDEANVEGWEIWKSTKQSKGYKKAFTQVASKHTYKNTKGLEAGTRYYYKVRAIAYDEAGNKIKSDWSNKAYRVAK